MRWRNAGQGFTGRALLIGLTLGILIHAGLQGILVPFDRLSRGVANIPDFAALAFPPSTTRFGALLAATAVTLEIAVLGTLIGVILGLPLSLGASFGFARSGTHAICRGVVSFCRTVPDVIWGLVAVVVVGLGPPAGVLAVSVHTVGVFGRLFADDLEHIDDRAGQLLWASGWPLGLALVCSKLPAAGQSFWSSVAYSLESAIRSSVIIGVVGAGGIGVELTTAMALLRYDEVLTIVMLVFALVLTVERLAGALRKQAKA